MIFFLIVDRKSDTSVMAMPSYSLCTDIISKLPEREGYKIYKIPSQTKRLDVEFVEEIEPVEVAEFYENVDVPIKPEDWYPDLP